MTNLARAIAITLLFPCAANGAIQPSQLKTADLVNPRGIDATNPDFGWIPLASEPVLRGQVQGAYQILVSDSVAALASDTGNLWDSGKVESDQTFDLSYAGKPLKAHQTCYWKVKLWDGKGIDSGWSEPASWTMGFLPAGSWNPTWINNGDLTAIFRKEVKLTKPVKRAWIYASALGIYELRMNGRKVGEELFAPGWTDYRKRVQYQRHEVTDLLASGGNVIGAELAPGWFSGKIGWFAAGRYGKRPAFAAELHLEFTDGSSQVVATDGTWKASAAPLTASDILDGDQYDSRLEQNGWDLPGFDDAKWTAAEVVIGEKRNMVAQRDQPVGVIREMKPVKVSEPTPGTFVYDLGQNITGVARIKVQGSQGTKVTLRFAERINPDGTLDVTNLKLAKATDTFILSGNGSETFQPKFTFHGFRWLSIEGLAKAPAPSDVTGVVIGSLLPEAGTFETSNPDLNQLISNLRWTISNSYFSIPLDSPQRSERLGWTGDANVMAASVMWFFDVSQFFAKWQRDILDAQSYAKGEMEGVMPNVAPRWIPKGTGRGGGWGDVGVNLPYLLWKRYADTDIIRYSYEGMAKWIRYLERNGKNHIIPVKARVSTAGDWENHHDDTPKDLVGSFYYALDVSQLAEMADAIGKPSDAAAYRKQFGEIRQAIIKEFVKEDGQVANGSQTAQVFALYLGLYPDGMKDKVLGKLVENIKSKENHISTGFLGTQWLLQVLANHGRADLAYTILLQKSGPSWLFMASNGQTSLWEGWDSLKPDGTFGSKRTSLGHTALGSFGDWLFQGVGGLTPAAESPGFKHFLIRPAPGGGLKNAAMSYRSIRGQIATKWEIRGKHLRLEVEVPVNTTATIVLPTANAAAITESEMPLADSPGITPKFSSGNSASFEVGSGRYSFVTGLPE